MLEGILIKLVDFVERENDVSVVHGEWNINYVYKCNFKITNEDKVKKYLITSIQDLYKSNGFAISMLNVKCMNRHNYFGCNHISAIVIYFQVMWY